MNTALATPIAETVPQADGLLRMLMGFEVSQVLMVSHRLGVYETLAREPASAAGVCGQVLLPEESGKRLLQACAALGLLRLEGDVFYNSVLAERYLVSGKPSYLGGLIEYYQGEFYHCYGNLHRAIEENRPQVLNEKNDVVDIFSAGNGEPGLQHRFLDAMHRLGLWEGERLAKMFPFAQINTLLDVGGGSGALAITLTQQFPHLKIQLFDRPSICPLASAYVSEARLSETIAIVPGDFWQDPLPNTADAILLSMVLHDWSPAKNLTLLRRCYDALPAGGYVLIFEQLLHEDRCGPMITCLTDLTMLLRTESGSEYTETDYHTLLRQAGFVLPQTVRTPGLRQLLFAKKP